MNRQSRSVFLVIRGFRNCSFDLIMFLHYCLSLDLLGSRVLNHSYLMPSLMHCHSSLMFLKFLDLQSDLSANHVLKVLFGNAVAHVSILLFVAAVGCQQGIEVDWYTMQVSYHDIMTSLLLSVTVCLLCCLLLYVCEILNKMTKIFQICLIRDANPGKKCKKYQLHH